MSLFQLLDHQTLNFRPYQFILLVFEKLLCIFANSFDDDIIIFVSCVNVEGLKME